MKKMKVILALILVVAMSATGCTKKIPKQTDNESVTTTTKSDGTDGEVVENLTVPEEGAELVLWTDKAAYGEAIAKGFMSKYPGVKVTSEEVGFSDAYKKMELDGPAGLGADVYMISHSRLNRAIGSGMVIPITGDVADRIKATLIESAIGSATYDGELYGAPVSTEAVAVFYNKDLVGDKPVETFEELFEFAKTFNNPSENKFAFMMNVANSYNCYGLLSSYGYRLFGPDGTDQDAHGFDSVEFEKGLEFVASLKEILPVASADLSDDFITEQFKQGKTAYILGGPWNVADYRNAGMNIGVITLPTVDGNVPTPFAGLKVAHVSAYTDYPNASMLLTEYMVSVEAANILYDINGKGSTLADISGVPGLVSDPYLSVFAEQFKAAFPVPNLQRMDYYYSVGEKTLALVFDGQLSPKDAAKIALEEWNSLVASE